MSSSSSPVRGESFGRRLKDLKNQKPKFVKYSAGPGARRGDSNLDHILEDDGSGSAPDRWVPSARLYFDAHAPEVKVQRPVLEKVSEEFVQRKGLRKGDLSLDKYSADNWRPVRDSKKVDAFEEREGENVPTWRQGNLGQHAEATANARVIRSTSSISQNAARHSYDLFWAADQTNPTGDASFHSFTIELASPVSLTEMNLILPGLDPVAPSNSRNPKSVAVFYCSGSSVNGDWMPARRQFISSDCTFSQLSWRPEEAARFWRVDFPHGGHNPTLFGFRDWQLISEDPCTRDKIAGIKKLAVTKPVSAMATAFELRKNLTSEQLEDRAGAAELGVTVDELDVVKKKFDSYDVDQSGFIDREEFRDMLLAFLGAKNKDDISKERFNGYWREVDTDGSGEVDFLEFLAWYEKIFKKQGLAPEEAYSIFGQRRLGRAASVAVKVGRRKKYGVEK